MNYTVYCDESRHTGGAGCQFAVIGGLWVTSEHRDSINRELKNLKLSNDLGSEVKWSRVSLKKIESYAALINYFWESGFLNYRAIVVDQDCVDYDCFHNGDKELGFYKFYYEMIEKWIYSGSSYNILLDYKNNSDAKRLPALSRCLINFGSTRNIVISNLTSIDSKSSHIAQLCDLLTGAIAADANGTQVESPKAELIRRMVERRGFSPLSAPSRSPDFCKFNVFRIALNAKRAGQ